MIIFPVPFYRYLDTLASEIHTSKPGHIGVPSQVGYQVKKVWYWTQNWSQYESSSLSDFIVECTIPNEEKGEKKSKEELTTPSWILYVDGALNFQGSGAKLILTDPNRVRMAMS